MTLFGAVMTGTGPGMTIGAAGLVLMTVALATTARAQDATPSSFNQALERGYEIVAVVGQGRGGADHVIYLKKDGRVIVCGFRFVLTDEGFDAKQSDNLGTCTGFRKAGDDGINQLLPRRL